MLNGYVRFLNALCVLIVVDDIQRLLSWKHGTELHNSSMLFSLMLQTYAI